MKRYQVGYRTTDGKVRYVHLSYDEGTEYNSLKSDESRKAFLQIRIDRDKIQDAINQW